MSEQEFASQRSIFATEEHLELQRSVILYKNRTIQLEYQGSSTLWRWEMEDNEDHCQETADLYQQLPKTNHPDSLAWHNHNVNLWQCTIQLPIEGDSQQRRLREMGKPWGSQLVTSHGSHWHGTLRENGKMDSQERHGDGSLMWTPRRWDTPGNNWRELPRTEDSGGRLLMAYAFSKSDNLFDWLKVTC